MGDEEAEKVVMVKGETILVLVGLVQIVSMIKEIWEPAGIELDWAMLVKLIWYVPFWVPVLDAVMMAPLSILYFV